MENVILKKPLKYEQNAVSLGVIILLIVSWLRLQPDGAVLFGNDSVMWTEVQERLGNR